MSQNVPNSVDVKQVPLSDTKTSGMSCVAKMSRNALIVDCDVACRIGTASIHFEWASTMISSINPSTGPTKSICRRSQSCLGQDNGCTAVLGGSGTCC
jgi:hypothetical protein